MPNTPTTVYYQPQQQAFHPQREWADGEVISHPETPARAQAILDALSPFPDDFDIREPEANPMPVINKTHHSDLIRLYQTAQSLGTDETVYPSFFPQGVKGDPTCLAHAGIYCSDTATPLSENTLNAALASASCAVQAATDVLEGNSRLVYALCRPPGHHAGYREYGGYCYFNNTALAANVLKPKGLVAVVDIDYHHGNGTQQIFYADAGVLFISIHRDPWDSYPYVTGYAKETGTGPGEGLNLNIPLEEACDGLLFTSTLQKQVIPVLKQMKPKFLVISAGFDTYKDDPLGDFLLETEDYNTIGQMLGKLKRPTVVVQEGGYCVPALGENARAFLTGLRQTAL